jgi:hypothetical protein
MALLLLQTAHLPARRALTGWLPAMVNPASGSGADAQCSGARTLSILPLPHDTDTTSQVDSHLLDPVTNVLSESSMADSFSH